MAKGKITPSLQSAPTRGGEFEDIGGIKAGHLRKPYEYPIVIIEKISGNGEARQGEKNFFSGCLTGRRGSVKKKEPLRGAKARNKKKTP